MNIAAAVPGLMDQSRFPTGTARFISDPSEIGSATLVIVDLDRTDDPARFVEASAHTIGYGSHVEEAALAAARAAGFDEVLPRSVFWRRLPELLTTGGNRIDSNRIDGDQ